MKPLKLIQLILIITVLTVTSCSLQKASITGTWTGTSISNPDKLFKNTLPDRRPGTVIFTADQNKNFTWENKNDKKIITGKYTCTGSTLILETKNEKPVRMYFTIKNSKLTLITDDGFTFTFTGPNRQTGIQQ